MELNQTISISQFKKLLEEHSSILVYLYQDKCGVCKTLFPKVKDLVENEFPEMELLVLEAEQNRELAAQLRMLAVPGILVYFEGKEYFRANGLLSLGELKNKIGRYYSLMYR
ncbi:thioredoxin family protein [Shivajiella indica]|uniref:Thioredoxin family protein n=1 Tax=Shivajiella indica TaxID=872115 RepID=A0ABW5B825_9BACT